MSNSFGIPELIEAISFPADARLNQRVPKKSLAENGAPTAADKRRITDGIDEIIWVAALKPNTIGVPEFKDDIREYLEIAVLHVTLRNNPKESRLIELVHRAIPYPVLLLTTNGKSHSLSVVHKRWAQNDNSKVVLEGDITVISWHSQQLDTHWLAFCAALCIDNQPHTSLAAFYQGWINTLLTLHAARLTGTFTIVPDSYAHNRQLLLQKIDHIDAELVRIRGTATQEKQMARLVELNLELQQLNRARIQIIANLLNFETTK